MTNKKQMHELLLKHLKVNIDEVAETTPIRELGVDSLDLMEILMDVEEEYNITFSNEELLSFKTLGDLISTLDKKI